MERRRRCGCAVAWSASAQQAMFTAGGPGDRDCALCVEAAAQMGEPLNLTYDVGDLSLPLYPSADSPALPHQVAPSYCQVGTSIATLEASERLSALH